MRTFLRDILIVSFTAIITFSLIWVSRAYIPFFASAHNSPVLVPIFLIIFIVVLTVAQAGLNKDADAQGLFTLAAISLKFILPAALAVIWFRLLKNNTPADILLFFIVYLALSTTAILLIIRNLKNRT